METWSEDFRLVALEDYEFESRQNKNNSGTISHVQLVNIPR